MAISRESQPKRSGWRAIFWNVAKIALALALAGVVLSYTNLNDLAALLDRVSMAWLVISFLSFYAIVWVTARRYWLLIGRKISFRETLNVVVVQTVIGNLIATSVGAVSYVAILRGKHQIRLSLGISSLLLARFCDLLLLFTGLVLPSRLVWPQILNLHWLVLLLVAGMMAIVFGVALLLIFRQRFTCGLDKTLRALTLRRIGLVDRIMRVMEDLASADLRQLRALVAPVAGYTVLIFLLMCAFAISNMRLFAVPVEPWPILFVMSLTQLTSLIPIQVLGGLGVYDVTSVYLYSLFGISRPEIAAVIIGIRIVFYAVNLLLLTYLLVDTWLTRNDRT